MSRPGYAPIEQYAGKSDQQGPWSDIYGLGATIYRAMTARTPNDAVERSQALAQNTEDSYQAGAHHAKRSYTTRLLNAVDHALAFRVQDRPQTIAAWRAELPPPVEAEIDTADWDSATEPTVAIDMGAPTMAVTIATHAAQAPRVPLSDEREGSAPAARLTLGATARARLARIERRHYLYGLAALVLSAVLVGAWLGQGVIDETRELATAPPTLPAAPEIPSAIVPPAAPVTAPAEAAAPEAVSMAEPSAASGAAATVTSPSEQVALLLFGAGSDVAALRLMSPSGQNAYEKYRAVLAIEPANDEALKGLHTLSDRYLALASRALDAQQFERATEYVNNAARAAPANPALPQARLALSARQPTRSDANLPVIAPRPGAPIVDKSFKAPSPPPGSVRSDR